MPRDVPADWPNVALSRRIRGPVHHWHLQEAGSGKTLVLLHGAGGSTHSFRDLIPILATKFRVIALDLPGHGFTQLGAQRRSGLLPMATDVQALLDQQGIVPHGFVAHSAGAAVALQMCREADGPSVLGINAALGHFEGLAGFVFPAMAKMLAAMPFSAKLFSGASSRPQRIAALIDSTGSKLTAEGHALYQRLVGDPDHVDGTLKMMAQWDLQPLLDDLSALTARVLFLTGSKDSTVPPGVSQRAAEQMRGATHISIEDRGHLLHEEVPELVAEHAFQFFGPK